MKAILVCEQDPNDRIVRSGVPYSIYQQLKKRCDDVIWIKPEIKGWTNKLVTLPLRLYYKLMIGLRYNPCGRNVLLSRMMAKDIERKISDIDYDFVFSTDTLNIAFLKTAKPIFVRIDAIFQSALNYYYFKVPSLSRLQGINVENKALNNLTKIFSPSQWIMDELVKYRVDFDVKGKVSIVETGANLLNNEVNYKVKHFSIDKSLNMLFIGIDAKRKGIDVAYKTLLLLRSTYYLNATLTIVGGKPDDYILEDKNVVYVGMLDKNKEDQRIKFYKQYENADLFIFPTKAEFHGIVNCEAAAYGLPIFSYNTGGVPSYVIDGVNGYVFPLSNNEENFAKKIYECIKFGQMDYLSLGSRNLFEDKFNWDIWGEKIMAEIFKIVKKQR